MPEAATILGAGSALPNLLLPGPVEPGERLTREFLAGRSPNTLQAYAQDLAAFAVFQGAGSPGEALEALIGLRAGEGNSRLLAWCACAAMQEAGPGSALRIVQAPIAAVSLLLSEARS